MLLSNNAEITFSKYFNDAILQYLTSANSIQNATLASWGTTGLNSPEKEYFYVNYNGLRILRDQCEKVSANFYKYYENRFTNYKIAFYILLGFIIF
jgi:hypothetical protein